MGDIDRMMYVQNKTSCKKFSFLALVFAIASSFSSAGRTASSPQESNYCAAIRGNGELVFAHWGALSRLVEERGALPRMISGGSSGSVTAFLISQTRTATSDLTSEEVSLLLKSYVAYIEVFKDIYKINELITKVNTVLPKIKSLMAPLALGSGADSSSAPSQEQVAQWILGNPQKLREFVGQYAHLLSDSQLAQHLNPELLKVVNKALNQLQDESQSKMERTKALGVLQDLYEGLKSFGSFDMTDPQFLFRPALLNFKSLAHFLGHMGDFYGNASLWRTWVRACGQGSRGQEWSELSQNCRNSFSDVTAGFLRSVDKKQPKSIYTKIDAKSLVSTSVLDSTLGRRAQIRLNNYQNFVRETEAIIQNSEESEQLKIGYFMTPANASKIFSSLDSKGGSRFGNFSSVGVQNLWTLEGSKNVKWEKMTYLGSANWSVILQTSPAEPGLSSVVPFHVSTERGDLREWVSAGGWADLEPIEILKAAGCSDVVYITRRGGPAQFGMGVAAQILGSPLVRSSSNEVQIPAINETQSLMYQLYSTQTLKSSFMRALSYADQVYCSDWNSLNGTKATAFEVFRHTYRLSEEWVHFSPHQTQAPVLGCSSVLLTQ